MAFSYRNPMETAINLLPSKFSDQALSSTSESIINKLDDLNASFSFSLKKEVEESLIKKGIELAPIPFRVHSHPACKTIENHIILRVIPLLFNKVPSIAFISMREEKVEKFLKVRNFSKYGEIRAMKPLNSAIDAKDNFRYLDTGDLNQNHPSMVKKLRSECLKNEWFPKVVFVHDELHFWSPENLVFFFDEMPEIKQMVGTVVCPPELMFGEEVSKNPRIYTFDLQGDDLHFFPDGVPSEGYVQSIKTTTWWFKTAGIQSGNSFLRISVIGSIYAHHIVTIDRGSMLQRNLFLEKPDCLLDSELIKLSSELSSGVIERSTMLSILTYLSCLKNPNKESALAKLRQLEKRDLFPDEAFLVSSISSTFIKYGVGDELDKGFLERVNEVILNHLPGLVQNYVNKKHHWLGLFRSFMKEISTGHIMIKREVLDLTSVNSPEDGNALFEDRDSSQYSYVAKKCLVRLLVLTSIEAKEKSFPTMVRNTRIDLRKNFVRRVNQQEGPEKRILMLKSGAEEAEPIENCSRKDQFSSNGVIFQNEMIVQEYVKSSKAYGKRKNCCVFDAIGLSSGLDPETLLETTFNSDISGDLFDAIENDQPLSIEMIQEVAIANDVKVWAEISGSLKKFNLSGRKEAFIVLSKGHAEPMEKKRMSKLIEEGGLSLAEQKGTMIEQIMGSNVGIYKIDLERAAKLVKSIKRGCTGILLEISPKNCELLALIMEEAEKLKGLIERVEFPFGLKMGIPGSGKSFEAKKFLQTNPMFQSMIVSPRRALAEDWSESIKGTVHKVRTFETALCESMPGLKMIVLDEVTLYPPGYLDLILLTQLLRVNQAVKGDFVFKGRLKETLEQRKEIRFELVVLGDMLQTQYYCAMDSKLLSKEPDSVRLCEVIGEKMDYLWYSMRLPKNFERMMDFQCLGGGGFDNFKVISELSVVKAHEYDALLVASGEDRDNASASILTMTYGESQGLTFKRKVLILLSTDTLRSSEQSIIVAMTRSVEGFDFVFSSGRTFNEFRLCAKKKMIGYILEGKKVPSERLTNLIPCKEINKIFRSGGLEEKASNDLFILPEIKPDFPEPDQIEMERIYSGPIWYKTHLPIISVNPLNSEVFERMQAKEKREFWHISRGFSEQFPDTDKGLIEDVMGFGFRFDSIFPRHNGSDDTTFWEGVKKRLRFSDPRREREKMEESRRYASTMLDIFIKALPEKFEVTGDDIEKGLNSFNQKRAEKPNALWIAHSNRSEIDWPLNHVFLFMKSQLCTKQEKMFTAAKAGQTLACFHHTVLFRFGPMLRAIESAFVRACGESYYIHSGKNFFALNEFVLKNQELFQGNSIESDYEAFDSSQDSMILAFEEALLKKIGVSEGFIRDYVMLKMNLGCRLGSFAIMRFTGEFCTFLFNTFANMLFTFIKYDVKHERDRILFAGDDMASLGKLRENSESNRSLLKKFSLKAKEETKKIPSFCGWYLTPDGILKSPKLLWARICVMKQRGLIDSCLDNYFLEAVFAYNLGEKLFSYFDEEQIEFHYAVSRFFISNKYKFSGEAKSSFFGVKQTFGSKCPSLKSMISLSELRKKISRLMLLKRAKFMVMLQCFLQKFYNRLGDSRPMSRLVALDPRKWYYQVSNFLMKLSLSLSKESLVNTRTCILARSLSALLLSFLILGKSKAESCFMMVQQILLKLGSSRPTMSNLIRGRLSSFSDLSTYSLVRIHTFMRQLKFIWNLKVLILKKGVKSLAWMSGAFIDFLIQLAIFVKTMVMGGGPSKRYGAVSTLNSRMSLLLRCREMLKRLNLSQLSWKQGLKGEISSPQAELPDGKRSFLLGWRVPRKKEMSLLGQHLVHLIELWKEKEKMSSAQDVIQALTRRAVNQWLWDHYIDPNHQVLEQGVRLDLIPEGMLDSVTTLVSCYKTYLFGNIAILGSSGKTQWPNVTINLNPVTVRGPNEANVTKNYTLNLSVVVPALETFRTTSAIESFKGSTFRQVCECFAAEACIFLKTNWSRGVSTNIYKKWPRALESAPWVAFDFCSGLKMNELTPDERKVVDRLTKRLFRTEGQKGVFEAGQEVNVDLEG